MTHLRLTFPHQKRPLCPYLLSVGIFGTGIVHHLWPEVEGYLASVVGFAWVWSAGVEERFRIPSERVPMLDTGGE